MAGRGAAPKAVLQRESRTQARAESSTKLAADGELRGPDIPEGDWHAQTLAWWETWRRSPQAQTFTATDWDVLAETAILHTRLWNGEASMAGEIRLRVAKWGATYEDRMRLKMSVDADVDNAAAASTSMPQDRRARLLRSVNGSPRA